MRARFFIVTIFCIAMGACISADDNRPAGPVGGVQSAKPVDSANLTTIQWFDSVKNMGTVIEGQQVQVAFRFKNTGTKPLVVESAKPGCGCTIASKPDQPIMPGQEGEIKASFNSEGRVGANHKTIMVITNTKPEQSHQVEFNVQVNGKAEASKS